MKRKNRTKYWALLLGTCIFVFGCNNWIIAGEERVTFALVLDSTTYNGDDVCAEVRDHDASGALLETLAAPLAQYPNAPGHSWVQLTTLEEVGTNQRYHLTFYIDIDSSGNLSTGDLNGIQTFDVMANANWSETKFYSSDLVAE